jgi:hypothetical protein
MGSQLPDPAVYGDETGMNRMSTNTLSNRISCPEGVTMLALPTLATHFSASAFTHGRSVLHLVICPWCWRLGHSIFDMQRNSQVLQ